MFEFLKEYPEIYDFASHLQVYYLITLTVLMYGLKNTNELDWYKDLLTKWKLEKGASWIAAIIIMLLFCLFRWLDADLDFNSTYVADLLRTMLVGIILKSVFIDLPIKIFNRFYTKKKDEN